MSVAELYVLSFPTGQVYLGVTSRGLARRVGEHVGHARRGKNWPLHRALRAFPTGFTARTLAVGEMSYILELEAKAITKWRSMEPEFGFNLASGGQTAPTTHPDVAAQVSRAMKGNLNALGTVPSAETRARLSLSKTGNKNALGNQNARGNVLSAETRAKIGVSSRGNRHLLGYRHTEESKVKMRAAALGNKNASKKPAADD